jgi:hypothetical protein
VDFASELAVGKPNSLGNTLKIVKIDVIPAVIITWSFWYYGIKRDMKSL